MWSHAPPGYDCPFCRLLRGVETEHNRLDDIVWQHDGTSTRQHNEPAGYQDVWHLHVHVFPRYDGDRLYERHEEKRWASPAERAPYAAKLRAVLSK